MMHIANTNITHWRNRSNKDLTLVNLVGVRLIQNIKLHIWSTALQDQVSWPVNVAIFITCFWPNLTVLMAFRVNQCSALYSWFLWAVPHTHCITHSAYNLYLHYIIISPAKLWTESSGAVPDNQSLLMQIPIADQRFCVCVVIQDQTRTR